MTKNLLVLLIIFISHITYTYSQYSIRGQVLDNDSKPLSFAAIGLLDINGHQVSVSKSATNGAFELKNVAYGTYSIVIKMLGYKTYKVNSLNLNKDIDLGKIKLEIFNAKIDEVLIQANLTSKASNIEKKEYSPAQLYNSQNASAAELMGSIPSLNLGGEDNNISLRGDENVTVLINGKISSLSGQSLSQIPASAIEKIEVITNPSSKVNSEGSAGVVNIVLKKAYYQLNSGYVAGSIGTNHKYNAQVGYNFSKGKFAFSTGYSFRYEDYDKNGIADRAYFGTTGTSTFYQSSQGISHTPNHFGRLGIEYSIGPHQSIIMTGSVSTSAQNDYETRSNTSKDVSGIVSNQWLRLWDENNENLIFDATLSYTLTNPKNNNTLSIEYSINGNNDNKTIGLTNRYSVADYISLADMSQSKIYNDYRRTTNAVQVDYSTPIFSQSIFETGMRAAVRDFRFTNEYYDIENSELISNLSLTNNFNFEENVYSLYGLMSNDWNSKLSSKIGLRLEQTNTRSTNFDSIILYSYNYFNAFPSAIFNYNLSQKAKVSASYALRINRPSPGMLNPLQDVTDPQSRRFGNPELKPELVHSMELSYGMDVDKSLNFSTAIYHKLSTNSITRFLDIDSLGAARVAVDNIGKLNMSGFELIANYRPTKWWNLSYNANLSYNTLAYQNQGVRYDNSYFNIQNRAISNFKLPKGFDIQIIAFYKSPFNTPQGKIDYMSNVDITLRKKVFGQKGLLTFGVTDLLDDKRFEIRASDVDFSNYFLRKRETKIWTLGFRYNFGADLSKREAKLIKQEKLESGVEGGM